MSATTTTALLSGVANRGSGLLDAITSRDLADATSAAYEKLDPASRSKIDQLTDELVVGLAVRRQKQVNKAERGANAYGGPQFGEVGARELLAAIGRLVR